MTNIEIKNPYFAYLIELGENDEFLRISAALFNSLKNSSVRECVPQDFIN